MDEKEIVLFQIERQIKSLYKDCLILIENRDEYIKKLENLLIEMGIDAYKASEIDYQKDRKYILCKGNDKIRELQEFVQNFEIKLNSKKNFNKKIEE